MASTVARFISVSRFASGLPILACDPIVNRPLINYPKLTRFTRMHFFVYQVKSLVSVVYNNHKHFWQWRQYLIEKYFHRLHSNKIYFGPYLQQASSIQDEVEILIEEDYLEEEEVEDDLDQDELPEDRPPKEQIGPEEVVSVLEAERAKNIEVVECDNPQSPYKFLVIASPYNVRHGNALIESVRRHFCKNYYFGAQNPSVMVSSKGWYVLDFHNGMLHIMKDELREKYDLASVWRVNEDDEEETYENKDFLPPPPKIKGKPNSSTRL